MALGERISESIISTRLVAMIWPSWLWVGSRFKLSLWLANRLATWTGLFYFWKRFRSHRLFWLWVVMINIVSVSALVLLFFWLHHRSVSLRIAPQVHATTLDDAKVGRAQTLVIK